MMINNRRPYFYRETPEKSQDTLPQTIPQNIDVENLKKLIVDSLRQLNKSVSELDKSVKVLEEKLDYVDSRIFKVEDKVNRYNSSNNDLSSIRFDLESLKKEKDKVRTYTDEEYDNRPVMPGTGFECITPEYLKNLSKR